MTNPMYGLLPDYKPLQVNIPTHSQHVHVTISNEVPIRQENPDVHVDEKYLRSVFFMPNSQGELQLMPLIDLANERLCAIEEKLLAI